MSHPSPSAPVQEIRWVGRIAVAVVRGDIDLSRSSEFQQQILLLLDEKPQRVVVNLAEMPYMDSSGLAALVKALARARKAGISLVLVGLCHRVRNLFEVTKLNSVFSILPTEKEALT